MNSIPDELADLLNYCHSLAKFLLNEQGEFYPFGVYLNTDNVMTQRLFNDGDDFPLSTGIINIIKYDFDHQLIAGSVLGSAITYEARVTTERFAEPVQAIVVRLNKQGIGTALLHYLPYRVIDNKVEYLQDWVENE
jgi:hypothetical protein